MVDKYSEWEFSTHWYFGNRMNNAETIAADAFKSGYSWDGLPYHEIVAEENATQFNFFEGEKALPFSHMIGFRFPELSPNSESTVTFVWEAKYDPRFYTGIKAFQILSDGKIHIESAMYKLYHADNPTWLMLPSVRVYGSPTRIGGTGLDIPLSSGTEQAPNAQPALNAPQRRFDYCYAKHHITGTEPTAFLIKPGQWYRFIYTLDWRTTPHRIWLWMESEDSPRTLLLADPVNNERGFVLQYEGERQKVNGFWFEFNNSRLLNESDFYVRVRNFFVLRNVLGKDL